MLKKLLQSLVGSQIDSIDTEIRMLDSVLENKDIPNISVLDLFILKGFLEGRKEFWVVLEKIVNLYETDKEGN